MILRNDISDKDYDDKMIKMCHYDKMIYMISLMIK